MFGFAVFTQRQSWVAWDSLQMKLIFWIFYISAQNLNARKYFFWGRVLCTPGWPQTMCLRIILNSWCSVLSHMCCDYGCVPPRPAHSDSCLPKQFLRHQQTRKCSTLVCLHTCTLRKMTCESHIGLNVDLSLFWKEPYKGLLTTKSTQLSHQLSWSVSPPSWVWVIVITT